MKLFYVKYSGTFGYIKPWTAVRDSETYSQQFLTPSMVEGIEKKLFPELLSETGVKKVVRHRLNYQGLDIQQEVTWSKGMAKKTNPFLKNKSILNKGVLLFPNLYLVFGNEEDAKLAFNQTICLARNEDLLFPIELVQTTFDEFEEINGFELIFHESENSFKVGWNRYSNEEMFGELKVFGNPIRE